MNLMRLTLTMFTASLPVLVECLAFGIGATSSSHQVMKQGMFLIDHHSKRDVASTQRPLFEVSSNELAAHSARKYAVLPIETETLFGYTFHLTNIALGSPSQPLRLLLDFDYGGLLTRGAGCLEAERPDECGAHPLVYNHSVSTTSQPLNESFYMNVGGHYVEGNVTMDTLNLLSLQVPDVAIGVVDSMHGENILLMILADLAIGLAPPNASAISYTKYGTPSTPHPNIWSAITASDALNRNIMTLSLSSKTLTCGSPPELHEADFTIPLVNKAVPYILEGTWNFRMHSLHIQGKDPIPLNISPPDLHAAMTLGQDIALALPKDIAGAVHDYLGVKRDNSYELRVDCDTINEMPGILINLDDIGAKQIELTPDDYVIKHTAWGGDESRCVLGIESVNAYGDDGTAAWFGEVLARRFELRFDLDEMRLGFTTI